MSRSLSRLARAIDAINDAIGRGVAWLLLLMVLGYCLVVVLRYGFGIGSIALQESVTYMHALVFMLAAAHTLVRGEHVRIDVFYGRWSERTRLWVDLLGSLLLLLPVALFILLASLGYVRDAWVRGEVSAEPGGLPYVYLLKTVIPIMAAQLVLAAVAQAIAAAERLASPSGRAGR